MTCVMENVLTFFNHNTEEMSIQELVILSNTQMLFERQCYLKEYFRLSSSGQELACFLHTGMQTLSTK